MSNLTSVVTKRIDESTNPVELRQIYRKYPGEFEDYTVRSAFKGRLLMMKQKATSTVEREILDDLEVSFSNRRSMNFSDDILPESWSAKKKVTPPSSPPQVVSCVQPPVTPTFKTTQKPHEKIVWDRKDDDEVLPLLDEKELFPKMDVEMLDLGFKAEIDIFQGKVQEQVEEQCLDYLLRLFKGKKSLVARAYGLTQKGLYNKLHKYKLGDIRGRG